MLRLDYTDAMAHDKALAIDLAEHIRQYDKQIEAVAAEIRSVSHKRYVEGAIA
jgi:hypothetical protein